MRLFFLIFILLCSCGLGGDYEKNKVLNFDYCNKTCVDKGTTMKKFEQGLGYVTCECHARENK